MGAIGNHAGSLIIQGCYTKPSYLPLITSPHVASLSRGSEEGELVHIFETLGLLVGKRPYKSSGLSLSILPMPLTLAH